jgi:ABC-2 type transport system ATP-binding protein
MLMLLSAAHLKKTYHTAHAVSFTAVSDVSFDVAAGHIVGFLGPNGAGKTTTIKMLLGLITPTQGTIQINGQQPLQALCSVGAVLEGSRNLYWRLSPAENFDYWGGLRGIPHQTARQRGLANLARFGLSAKANQPVRELSRGMQQIVAICCALIHQPKLLLPDEPTLGLDLPAVEKIQTIIRQLVAETQLGVLLTTHDMGVAQALADDLLMIDRGKIAFRGRTASALAGFSPETYALAFTTPPSPAVISQLTALGTLSQPAATTLLITLPNPAYLSQLLGVLSRLPLTAITKKQADLAALFKHVLASPKKEGEDHAYRPAK